ncbi:sodium/hydrogen exchanger family protein [Ophiocordyceps sinensis CO18]|nr:sodium/hydrogen exchanger family protein [Ophiocordyceps sinensis CO18]
MQSPASLPYQEPGVVTLLVQSSFLLLLNIADFALDRALYCGLVGQVFLGIAWGTPGAKWLDANAEAVMVQLGYLGLLLIVYQGGLSTSLEPFKANIFLSAGIAITGVGLPMALSFVLGRLIDATYIQCFAAGAALCSTSLGTTLTVLGTSGLIKSRLGVVLSSAAIMDDVVGLVMVQVISNLGQSDTSFSAATVVRPLMASLAFTVFTPLVCVFVAKPVTLWLISRRAKKPSGLLNVTLRTTGAAFVIQTLVLLGCIAGATYAGTSNLLAAFAAGAAINWWDSDASLSGPHSASPPTQPATRPATSPSTETALRNTSGCLPEKQDVGGGDTTAPRCPSEAKTETVSRNSGLEIYDKFYAAPVDRVLRPFFFASIGFSIPITEMFSGEIVWKGLVYAVLMTLGKVACGVWLLRLRLPAIVETHLRKLPRPRMNYFWGKRSANADNTSTAQAKRPASNRVTSVPSPSAFNRATSTSGLESLPTNASATNDARSTPDAGKPRSLYPASILGCAMTARGEIGFLISSMAESNKIFASNGDRNSSSDVFLVVTWAIVVCTIIGPPAVGLLVRRVKKLQQGVEKQGRIVRAEVLGVWGAS